MREQLKEINPSAKAPLFRRLMTEENLAYLRDDKSIVGFELNLDAAQRLSGFTLIGIQKHTIYAYRSDLEEEPTLVLFPPLDKLFDSTFNMLDLDVTKRRYTSADFIGTSLGTGTFGYLVKDLTPPEKEVDIPDGVSDQMIEQMKRIQDGVEAIPLSKPIESVPSDIEVPVDDQEPQLNDFDDYGGFDEGGFDEGGYEAFEDYDEPSDMDTEDTSQSVEEPVETVTAIEEDPRTTQLKAQVFETLPDLSDYVHLRLGVQKSVCVQVTNRALQSAEVAQGRVASVDLAVMLFGKLFNDKRL